MPEYMKREPKDFLTFDDPGASDDEPVKGVTIGDIRAWYDQYDRLVLSWADCRERLREETNTVTQVWRALGISTFEEARGKAIWELVAELKKELKREMATTAKAEALFLDRIARDLANWEI